MKISSFRKVCLTTWPNAVGLVAILFLSLSTLTVSAAPKEKNVLYAATGTFGVQGVLYTLNPKTGALLTTVGPLNDASGHNYGLTGLRYDAMNGILYGATTTDSTTDPNYLVTVNPTTAQVTPIGPFGNFLTDIAINPKTGLMYGVSGNNQKFYTVNIQTGVATQIGSTGIGFQNGGGLASTTTGLLYGANNFSFYTYNKANGKATLVGLTLLPDLVKALAFDPTNTLYGMEGGGGTDNTHLRFLVTINRSTGLGVEIGDSINDLDALAFVPIKQ
ncbi:MAG TPA: hypothetical protein VGG02_05235 [Chthoniobacterales bacterium]|jgi:hypothetical protein